jgi:hypothetical protein
MTAVHHEETLTVYEAEIELMQQALQALQAYVGAANLTLSTHSSLRLVYTIRAMRQARRQQTSSTSLIKLLVKTPPLFFSLRGFAQLRGLAELRLR